MPSNMKMPIIRVTPSSPSPDPNHPDYPEFFEDKLYLEHCGAAAANRGSAAVTEVVSSRPQTVASDVSFDRFSLVIDPAESDDDDVNMIENVKLCPQRSSLKMRRQNSLIKSNLELQNKKI